MLIEPAGAKSNCAWGFLLSSLIPTQAQLANTQTVGYFRGYWLRYIQ